MAIREREEKGSQRKPKGSQLVAKAVSKGNQNGAKRMPKWKRDIQTHPLRNRNEKVEKQMRKECYCMPKGCHNGANIDAQSHLKFIKTDNGTTHEHHEQ